MKNIEKYYDAIKQKLQTTDVLNLYCTVNEIRTGRYVCTERRNCRKCCLKNIEWLNEEYKDPKHILNDQEKEIVKAMIDFAHKCGVNVIHVCKFQDKTNGVYIYCKFIYKENKNRDVIESPWLPNNMFKGMENDRDYTIEELGL